MAISTYCSMFNDEVLGGAIDTIVSQAHPAVIICYGVRTRSTSSWSCFFTSEKSTATRAYDLLIVIHEDTRISDLAIQNIVEQINTDDFTITAVVHTVRGVQEAMRNGSFFFNRVCAEGKKLYCRDLVHFPHCKIESVEKDRAPAIEAQWNKWFSLSKKFLKGASYYLENGWPDLAAFMLHQAVEHAAIALIRVHLGYRPSTHNLKRLVALTENFAPSLGNVFLKGSKDDADLFNKLCSAYSDVRYKDEYAISGAQASMLFDRITSLVNRSELLFFDYKERSIQHIVPSTFIK